MLGEPEGRWQLHGDRWVKGSEHVDFSCPNDHHWPPRSPGLCPTVACVLETQLSVGYFLHQKGSRSPLGSPHELVKRARRAWRYSDGFQSEHSQRSDVLTADGI
jgi:hypothetical protein